MRILYSAGSPCKAGCKYCFAKWTDYPGQSILSQTAQEIKEKEAIIYPCCDGEFFDQENLIDVIYELAESMDKIYVSISAKQHLGEKNLRELAQLNDSLLGGDKGFVKFGISLSNKSRLDEIEPGTMSYSERLELARQISETGMLASLTLKPVLPFIQNEEYFEIIDDFGPYLRRMLIGGLYVNQKSEFYTKYVENQWNVGSRSVQWLNNVPIWSYVEDDTKMAEIRNYANDHGVHVYNSDVDLIKSCIQ